MDYDRFVVELENNHHYVLVDVVTGYQYYTPAQDDAMIICNLLNSQQKRLDSQREQIKKLNAKLDGNIIQEECITCRHCDSVSLNMNDDLWCDLKERSVYKYDSCNLWEKK